MRSLPSNFRNVFILGEANPGGFQTGVGFLFSSGKVLTVSRTLSGLFLVGASQNSRPNSGVNKSARERIGRQNFVPEIPLQKGVFGSHTFSKEL